MKAKVWKDHVTIMCPGCNEDHVVNSGWTFNGDTASPTLSPSLLRHSGHYASAFRAGDDCWCTYDAENPSEPSGFSCGICHSFVRDGQIQFLGDCTHSLRGQTVPLPDVQ